MWRLAVGVIVATGCRQVFGIDDPTLGSGAFEAGTGGPRKLALHNPTLVDLVEFPLPIVLDASHIDYTRVSNPTTDLRFDDTSGHQLAAEVESWNPSGQSVVWVRVPLIHAGLQPDSITMSFGPNVGAATTGAFTGYTMVHHFGSNLKDSAGTFDGTAIGASATPGILASGVELSGSGDQRVTFAGGAALFDGWSAFSLELWLRPDYTAPGDILLEPEVMDKGTSLGPGRVYVGNNMVLFQVDFHFIGAVDGFLDAPVTLGAWNYLVYTFDGSTLALYQNGALAMMQVLGPGGGFSLLPDSNPYYLGSPTSPVHGAIDELRARRQATSGDWIRAQYAAATGTFVTFEAP